MVDPLHHQAHLTHNHDQLDQMTTTRYRVGVLVPIVLFLIALPLFQKVLGKNITGYLDKGHRDLRGKVGIQGKVEIPVVPIEHMPVVARLASAGQCCPPSTSELIELTLNGPGEKKITFPKEGNAGDVHKKIIECFPALCAGYELLRSGYGRSKDLLLIPMPQDGFTVAYLKSVLGQAKGYLRPLQRDITLMDRQADADSDKVSHTCSL